MIAGDLLLLVPVFFSCAYDLAGTVCFRSWLREKSPTGPDSPCITVFRPLKRNVPDLAAKLTDLCLALEEGDQLLVGVYADDAEQHRMAMEILTKHGRRDARVILCEPDRCPNPKINKLLQMTESARHDHWVVMDAEVENARTFLPEFRREWTARGFPVLSPLYRFRELNIDVAQVPATLWPGLVLLRKFGPARLTLGACLAITRSQIEKLGSWEAVRDCLAEDFQIGRRAAALGEQVILSNQMVVLDNDPPGIQDLLRHQYRVSATYRICQPAGFAGSLFTHGPSFALVLVLLQPGEGWRWLLLSISAAFRTLAVLSRCRAAGWKVPVTRTMASVLAGGFLETIFWIAAWLPLRIRWGVFSWRVLRDGRLN